MFFSIPSSSEDTLVNTPLGAKAITHVFFENKNEQMYTYEKDLTRVSISVDGRQICRNLMILPFCTSAPYGNDTFAWQDVALRVNMNVDLSEIKISGTRNNDFNIVFVCEEKEIDEAAGVEFVETKKFPMLDRMQIDDAETVIRNRINEKKALIKKWEDQEDDYGKYLEEKKEYDQKKQEYDDAQETLKAEEVQLDQKHKEELETYAEELRAYNAWTEFFADAKEIEEERKEELNDTTTEITITEKSENGEEETYPYTFTYDFDNEKTSCKEYADAPAEPQEPTKGMPTTQVPPEPQAPEEVAAPEGEKPATTIKIGKYEYDYSWYDKYNRIRNLAWSLVYSNETTSALYLGHENQMTFDREPSAFFAYPVFSPNGEKFVINSDVKLNFTLGGADNELFPPRTDIEIVSANEKIPFRKALWTFDQASGMRRSLSVSLDINGAAAGENPEFRSEKVPQGSMGSFDVYFFFIYKKLI